MPLCQGRWLPPSGFGPSPAKEGGTEEGEGQEEKKEGGRNGRGNGKRNG